MKERRGQENDEGKWERAPDSGNRGSLMFLFSLRSKNRDTERETWRKRQKSLESVKANLRGRNK